MTKLLVVMGLPGAGKSTFAEVLQAKGFVYFTTGNKLRQEVSAQTPLGCAYQNQITRADSLIPHDIITSIVRKCLIEEIQQNRHIVLDGFPKTMEQVEFLDQFIKEFKLETGFVWINADPKKATERILRRMSCSECNRVYNMRSSPPKEEGICDDCHLPLVSRHSDNKKDLEKRYKLYQETTLKAIEFYKKTYGVIELDGNQSLEDAKNYFALFANFIIEKPNFGMSQTC